MPKGRIRFGLRRARKDASDTCACKFHNCRGALKPHVSAFNGAVRLLCEQHLPEVRECEWLLMKNSGRIRPRPVAEESKRAA